MTPACIKRCAARAALAQPQDDCLGSDEVGLDSTISCAQLDTPLGLVVGTSAQTPAGSRRTSRISRHLLYSPSHDQSMRRFLSAPDTHSTSPDITISSTTGLPCGPHDFIVSGLLDPKKSWCLRTTPANRIDTPSADGFEAAATARSQQQNLQVGTA
jgi:hypothetical protein